MLFRLALRNLLRHRRRTAITLAAVALGLAAVVSVRGILDGLQGLLINGVVDGGTGALQVHKAGWGESLDASPFAFAIDDADAVCARIEGVAGVSAAAPRLTFPAMVSVGEQSLIARVTAIDPVREARVSPLRDTNLVTGASVVGVTDLVLGTELFTLAKATLQTQAALLTGDADGVLNGVDTRITGTIAAQAQAEKRAALMHIDNARTLLRVGGVANEIAVALDASINRKDAVAVEAAAARLRATLGPTYEVHTWQKLAPFVSDAQATQNSVLSVLIGVFLVVILFGVANTLLMSVMERVREIGTLIALGMRQRDVMALFVVEGALLGLVGAIVGCAIGTVVVVALGHNGIVIRPPGASVAATIRPTIELVFLLRVVALAVVGAAFASLLPARRGSRLDPAVALSSL